MTLTQHYIIDLLFALGAILSLIGGIYTYRINLMLKRELTLLKNQNHLDHTYLTTNPNSVAPETKTITEPNVADVSDTK